MEELIFICEHCDMGQLVYHPADEPYQAEHYSCPVCDSTYPVEYEVVFEADF